MSKPEDVGTAIEKAWNDCASLPPIELSPEERAVIGRAAIIEMREPTLAMTVAARLRWNSGHDKTAWRLMCDEALR
jgi:ribosomal protein S12